MWTTIEASRGSTRSLEYSSYGVWGLGSSGVLWFRVIWGLGFRVLVIVYNVGILVV